MATIKARTSVLKTVARLSVSGKPWRQAPDYKYDGVKVIACNGVVQLSGFVNTSAQKNSAGEVASKVVGVKSVENNLTVKD